MVCWYQTPRINDQPQRCVRSTALEQTIRASTRKIKMVPQAGRLTYAEDREEPLVSGGMLLAVAVAFPRTNRVLGI